MARCKIAAAGLGAVALGLAVLPFSLTTRCAIQGWQNHDTFLEYVSPQDYLTGKYRRPRAPTRWLILVADCVTAMACAALLLRKSDSIMLDLPLHRNAVGHAVIISMKAVFSVLTPLSLSLCQLDFPYTSAVFSAASAATLLCYLASEVALLRISLLRLEALHRERSLVAARCVFITGMLSAASAIALEVLRTAVGDSSALRLLQMLGFALMALCYLAFQILTVGSLLADAREAYKEAVMTHEVSAADRACQLAGLVAVSGLTTLLVIVGFMLDDVFPSLNDVMSALDGAGNAAAVLSASQLWSLSAGSGGSDNGPTLARQFSVLRNVGRLAKQAALIREARAQVERMHNVNLGKAVRAFEEPVVASTKAYAAACACCRGAEPEAFAELVALENTRAPGRLVQRTADIDTLLQDAAAAQQELKRRLAPDTAWAATVMDQHFKDKQQRLLLPGFQTRQSVAHWVDALLDPGIKKQKRIEEKTAYKYKDKAGVLHFERVRDISRLALMFHSAGKLLDAIPFLQEVFDVVEIENRFVNPTALGWSDITCLVRIHLPGLQVHIAELQLQLWDYYTARQQAHRHYDFLRSEFPRLGVPAEKVDDVTATLLSIFEGALQSDQSPAYRSVNEAAGVEEVVNQDEEKECADDDIAYHKSNEMSMANSHDILPEAAVEPDVRGICISMCAPPRTQVV